jgi:hypothetical protein
VYEIAPKKSAQGNYRRNGDHPEGDKEEAFQFERSLHDDVHSLPYKLGNNDLRGVYRDKADEPAQVTPAVTEQIREKAFIFPE